MTPGEALRMVRCVSLWFSDLVSDMSSRINLLSIHLVPPIFYVDVIRASFACPLSQTPLDRHLWFRLLKGSDTELSTVGDHGFPQIFQGHSK